MTKKKKIKKIANHKTFYKLLKDSPVRAMIYLLALKVDEIIEHLNDNN